MKILVVILTLLFLTSCSTKSEYLSEKYSAENIILEKNEILQEENEMLEIDLGDIEEKIDFDSIKQLGISYLDNIYSIGLSDKTFDINIGYEPAFSITSNYLPDDFISQFNNLENALFMFPYRQSDILGLSNNQNLKVIKIFVPFIDLNYSGLSELPVLEYLEINEIKPEQLALLSEMNYLKILKIEKYNIEDETLADYNSLPNMNSLEELYIKYPKNLDFLKKYPNIQILKIELSNLENNINLNNTMLDNIPQLNHITTLIIRGCFSSINGISTFLTLEYLLCGSSHLSSIDAVKGLVNIRTLIIGTAITSIEPLKNLINLEYLDISSNKLTSLNGLENKENLDTFKAYGNLITDEQEEEVVDVLLTLPNLRFFEMDTRPDLNERYVTSGIGALNVDEQLYNSTS